MSKKTVTASKDNYYNDEPIDTDNIIEFMNKYDDLSDDQIYALQKELGCFNIEDMKQVYKRLEIDKRVKIWDDLDNMPNTEDKESCTYNNDEKLKQQYIYFSKDYCKRIFGKIEKIDKVIIKPLHIYIHMITDKRLITIMISVNKIVDAENYNVMSLKWSDHCSNNKIFGFCLSEYNL